jgi:type II secretory pathway pseudopilin PulG
MRRASLNARLRARLDGGERGFTLIEAVIAITLIFASLTALAFTATNGFRYVALGRERQAATGIANQVMEETRGLAYAKIQQGLSSTVLGTDPNLVTGCPADDVGVYRFLVCSGEKIVTTGSLSNVLPLVPNNGTCPGSTLPLCSAVTYPVTYSWRTYITNNNPQKNPFRVTVMVSWTSKAIATLGTQTVKLQSLFWSPSGCVSSSTHPFAAPCQPFFFGQASQAAGKISVAGTIGSTTFQSGWLSMMSGTSDIQQEQVVQIQSSLAGTGTSITDGTGTRTTGSTAAITTAADGDPANTAPPYSAPPFSPTGGTVSSPTTTSSSVNWIKLTNPSSPSADTGSMDAAAFASGSSVCPPAPAPPEVDGISCGGTRVTQGGLQSVTGNIVSNNPTVDGVTFLQLAAPASATTTFSNRDAISGQAGRVTETITRTIGRLDIGGLPAGFTATPSGFSGYFVSLTNYSDTVTAIAGSTAGDPVATITSGMLSYYNGSGYTTVNLATTPTYSIPSSWTQTVQQTNGAKKITVTMATTGIAMGSQPSKTSSPSGSGSILRNDVTSSIGSPMSGQFSYSLAMNNSPAVVTLTFTLDLGAISARAVYGAAPTAG